ncbi:MAG: response regulator, partial [Dehalococcoidales bacterium]|nr:response regulator [Dehalococcoidales bacterium]
TALNKLSSEEYDLILLDIKLPGMSGIEFYNHLKQIDSPLTERIVFVTGDTMGADTKKFLAAVKASYISKPFNAEQLNEAINLILSKPI